MTAVRVNVAAQILGVDGATIRRWLQQGAPVVSDRRPRLVDPEALRQWRQGSDALEAFERAMLDTLKRDGGEGSTVPQLLHIADSKAAMLLLATYERMHRELTGKDLEPPYSPTVTALREIVSRERASDARSGKLERVG